MITEVTRNFDNRIKEITKDKPDLQRHLLLHQVKPKAIQNTCDQLREARFKYPTMTKSMYYDIIKLSADFFMRNALEVAETKLLSEAEKSRIVKEQEHKELLARKASGEEAITEADIMEGF